MNEKHSIRKIAQGLATVGVTTWLAIGIVGCGNAPAPASAPPASQPAAPPDTQAATPAANAPAAPAPAATDDAGKADKFAAVGPAGEHVLPATYKAFTFDMTPPMDSKEHYVQWMVENRGEDPKFLGERWDRYEAMLRNNDLQNDQTKRAFLLTPREEFVRRVSITHSYDNNFLDIGYGVTISGPHAVSRMTSVLDVKPTDKVLEIGTGSGYQSALLGHITDKVWTIEIIQPLATRTRAAYDGVIAKGYSEYKNVHTKQADGYYGWPEEAPFDKIIVTCGIDHVPPALLQQLKVGGIMVIPVGPPGAQHVLKVTKETNPDGTIKIARSDIYNGKIVPFPCRSR